MIEKNAKKNRRNVLKPAGQKFYGKESTSASCVYRCVHVHVVFLHTTHYTQTTQYTPCTCAHLVYTCMYVCTTCIHLYSDSLLIIIHLHEKFVPGSHVIFWLFFSVSPGDVTWRRVVCCQCVWYSYYSLRKCLAFSRRNWGRPPMPQATQWWTCLTHWILAICWKNWANSCWKNQSLCPLPFWPTIFIKSITKWHRERQQRIPLSTKSVWKIWTFTAPRAAHGGLVSCKRIFTMEKITTAIRSKVPGTRFGTVNVQSHGGRCQQFTRFTVPDDVNTISMKIHVYML